MSMRQPRHIFDEMGGKYTGPGVTPELDEMRYGGAVRRAHQQEQQGPAPTDERAALLAEMLQSPGWQEVAVPALLANRAYIEKQLARNRSLILEQIRFYQGVWSVIDDLLSDPRVVFSGKEEAP
jgi:hypothetical protein